MLELVSLLDSPLLVLLEELDLLVQPLAVVVGRALFRVGDADTHLQEWSEGEMEKSRSRMQEQIDSADDWKSDGSKRPAASSQQAAHTLHGASLSTGGS